MWHNSFTHSLSIHSIFPVSFQHYYSTINNHHGRRRHHDRHLHRIFQSLNAELVAGMIRALTFTTEIILIYPLLSRLFLNFNCFGHDNLIFRGIHLNHHPHSHLTDRHWDSYTLCDTLEFQLFEIIIIITHGISHPLTTTTTTIGPQWYLIRFSSQCSY